MIGPEDEPAGQHKTRVEKAGAQQETKDVGRGAFHRQDEYVVGAKEAEVAQEAEPDEEAAGAEEQARHVPQVGVLAHAQLNAELGEAGEDDKEVVDADHDVPEVEELQPLGGRKVPAVPGRQEGLCLVTQELGAQQGAQAEHQRGRAHNDHAAVERENEREEDLAGTVGSNRGRLGAGQSMRLDVQRQQHLAVMVTIVEGETDGQAEAVWRSRGGRQAPEAGRLGRPDGHRAQVEGQDERLDACPVQVGRAAGDGRQPLADGGQGRGQDEAGRLEGPVQVIFQAARHIGQPKKDSNLIT